MPSPMSPNVQKLLYHSNQMQQARSRMARLMEARDVWIKVAAKRPEFRAGLLPRIARDRRWIKAQAVKVRLHRVMLARLASGDISP